MPRGIVPAADLARWEADPGVNAASANTAAPSAATDGIDVSAATSRGQAVHMLANKTIQAQIAVWGYVSSGAVNAWSFLEKFDLPETSPESRRLVDVTGYSRVAAQRLDTNTGSVSVFWGVVSVQPM